MLIKEYRICMPMTVEEYRIAQLYMIQKKSREESTGSESGVEILKNEPYEDGPGGNGQYTFKIYHVGSHLPVWLRSIIPEVALRVEEEAWNAYPYTKTRYKVPFMEKFSLEIETMYLDDAGEQENVFALSPADLNARFVDYIDIVNDPLTPSKPTEDLSTYVSQVTGRGPLLPNWRAEFQEAMRTGRRYPNRGTKPDATGSVVTEPLPMRIMCAYKVCRVEFRYWGMQSKVESFIQEIALRRTMVSAHRQAWTWQDEWYGLTMKDIRRLEAETAKALALKMGRPEANLGDGANLSPFPPIDDNHTLQQAPPSQLECEAVKNQKIRDNEAADDLAPPMTFGSCLSFASVSEHASMFQSLQGSDRDDEDFFDVQSVNTSGEVTSATCPVTTEGIHFTKSGEVAQTNVLLFVLHGGCLQGKVIDESSRHADYYTFKSLLESTVTNIFPDLQSRVIIQLISCPSLTAEAVQILNMLDPSSLEPDISGPNKAAMRSIIPIGNIPLLLTTSPHYPQNINQLAQLLNEGYVEFRNSVEDIHFSGCVFVVADCVGSIMLFDLLVSSNSSLKRGDMCTNMEYTQLDIQESPSLLFDIQDVFFLGSPLGLLLSLRQRLSLNPLNRVNEITRARPSCKQIFNIFSLADPFAYRLEPLLDPFFEHIPVVHLPSSIAGRSPNQWQHLRECLSMEAFKANVNANTLALSPIIKPSSIKPAPSLLDKTEEQPLRPGSWWGHCRVDVGLHCPENVQNIPSRALPSLVYSSYWESKDASCFIIWQIAERLHDSSAVFPRLVESIDGASLTDDNLSHTRVQHCDEVSSPLRAHNSSPSMNGNGVSVFSRQFRNSISSRLRFKSKMNERAKASCLPYSLLCFSFQKRRSLPPSSADHINNPNHRANDAIIMEGQPQIVTARFTFGPLDLSSMANEEVKIFYQPLSMTSSKKMPLELLGSQVTDSTGRLSFQIPESLRLPIGLHRLQLVPTVLADSDDQAVELTLAIVPPNCKVVICSIDGSFAASLSLMGKLSRQTDPKVRAGSVDIMRHWHSLGYLLIYISARPDMQHRQVTAWLTQHNFPPGLTFFLDGIFTDPLRQKALLLHSLVEQNKLFVHCAYGSAKDVSIYRSLGLKAHQIFAVGKLSRRQTMEATPIREGYASHIKELVDQQHLSTPATGPLSAAVLRDAAELFISSPPPVYPAVFFDLPENIGSDLESPSSPPGPVYRG